MVVLSRPRFYQIYGKYSFSTFSKQMPSGASDALTVMSGARSGASLISGQGNGLPLSVAFGKIVWW